MLHMEGVQPARAVRPWARHKSSFMVLLLVLSGCGPSEKEQQAKLDELQNKAKEELAAVQKGAAEKLAAAEKEIASLKAAAEAAGTQARAEAETEIAKVKEESEKLAAEAALALSKARA